ncbi:MAG: penicillin-binding protein 2 [Planctomycetota bacterium]
MTPRADRTLTVMLLLLAVLGAGFFGRVVQLQTSPSEELRPYAEIRRGLVRVPAARGTVRDRRGRVLAMTAFAWQAFVDPVRLDPETVDETIVELAGLTATPAHELGPRLVAAIESNLSAEDEGRTPRRYLRVGGPIDEVRAASVRSLERAGVHLERVPVRTYPAGDLIASVVGKVGAEHEGRLGVEHEHDASLAPTTGLVRYTRDSRGRPLWIERGDLELQRRGGDLTLTIDLEIQRIAIRRLNERVDELKAAGGRVVVLDPVTGDILAMGDTQRTVETAPFPWVPDEEWAERRDERRPPRARYAVVPRDEARERDPSLARNRCVEDVYEPGSTFKPIVFAAAYERGVFGLDDVVETHNGSWRTPYGRPIPDVHEHERMPWRDVLYHSSNIAMVKAGMGLSHDELRGVVGRFGFGRKTGIAPAAEASGIVTSAKGWNDFTHTSVSFGHELAVTPLQMARAFAVFARPGELRGTLPDVALVMPDRGGRAARASVRRRVLSVEAASVVVEPLTRVAEKVAARIQDGPPLRYSMFGKSGTAKIPLGPAPDGFRKPTWAKPAYYDGQYIASFVGAAPASDPRVVVLVTIDDPGPHLKRYERYGSWSAGPAVRLIAEDVLRYLGTEPDRPAETESVAVR